MNAYLSGTLNRLRPTFTPPRSGMPDSSHNSQSIKVAHHAHTYEDRTAYSVIPWPVLITCPEGTIRWTNQAAKDYWRNIEFSLVDQCVSSFIRPAETEAAPENGLLAEAAQFGRAGACVSLGVWKTISPQTETETLVEIYVCPQCHIDELIDACEEFTFFMVDVSRELQSKEEIRRRDKHLHQILDNTAAVIYVKTTDGQYRFVNKQFEDLFHVTRSQVIGKTDFDIFPQEMAERFRSNDDRVIKTNEVVRVEEVAPHDDGIHNYLSVKFPLTDHRGDVNGVAGISSDMTDLIKARQELETAQAVQNLLYPKEAPSFPGFDISGTVNSAELACGDYFDFISQPGDLLDVAIGDVSGHGLGPALEMVGTRAYLHALLASEMLDSAFHLLNNFLIRDLHDTGFVTLFLARFDPYSKTMYYVGAGHNGYLFRANGDVEELKSTSPLLGIDSNAKFRASSRIQLEAGDLFLATTDGILECMDQHNDIFGHDRIIEYVNENRHLTSHKLSEGIILKALNFGQNRPQSDDMTAVVVKVIDE